VHDVLDLSWAHFVARCSRGWRIYVPHHVEAVALDPPSLRRADQVVGIITAHIVDRIAGLPSGHEMTRLHVDYAFGLVAIDLDLRICEHMLGYGVLGHAAGDFTG